MSIERKSPDAILELTNLAGTVSNIQDDPDTPDEFWLEAGNNNADTVCRVSFPTPTSNPTIGADLQEFKIWVKKWSGTGTPLVRIELYENGTFVATVLADTGVTSLTGELHSGTWDANLLGTADGSLVECRVYGTKSGGSPTARATVDVGAVEWNVTYTAGVVQYLAGVANGITGVVGTSKISKKIVGVISCVASTTGSLTVTVAGVALAGIVSGMATISGMTKVTKKLASLTSGVANVSGLVKMSKRLAAVNTGLSTVSGQARILKKIAGTISGVSSVIGILKVGEILLAGIINGIATVTGVLGYHRLITLVTELTTSPTLSLSVSLQTGFSLGSITKKGLELTSEVMEK